MQAAIIAGIGVFWLCKPVEWCRLVGLALPDREFFLYVTTVARCDVVGLSEWSAAKRRHTKWQRQRLRPAKAAAIRSVCAIGLPKGARPLCAIGHTAFRAKCRAAASCGQRCICGGHQSCASNLSSSAANSRSSRPRPGRASPRRCSWRSYLRLRRWPNSSADWHFSACFTRLCWLGARYAFVIRVLDMGRSSSPAGAGSSPGKK